MLEIKKLQKKYGRQIAVDQLSYVFTSGIYGLLGPNGAGKTTLIGMIMGAVQPDSGDVLYKGTSTVKDRRSFVSNVGYLPQSPRFYKDFRAVEFLYYICELKAIHRRDRSEQINGVLNELNLVDACEKKIGAFSGGMRQRLGIAQALLGDPKILIFDEPTAGLDPVERIRFRNLISQFSSDRMIIIATHIVPDVEFIAQRILLMDEGVIINSGKPEALVSQINGKVWSVRCAYQDIDWFVDRFKISNILYDDESYSLRIVNETAPVKSAIQIRPRLEEAYIYFTESLHP